MEDGEVQDELWRESQQNLRRCEGALAALRARGTRGASARMASALHDLKGAAAFLGVHELAEAVLETERLLAAGRVAGASSWGAELAVALARLRSVLVESWDARGGAPARVDGWQRLAEHAARLAEAVGKRAALTIRGDVRAIPKKTLSRLRTPLLHLLRNAVDHGIETVPERVARGKPAEGAIVLRVARRGSHLHLVLSDDGAGFDRRALARAFERGFSTAIPRTRLSGSGVGLADARRAVESLGGTIGVVSRPGVGTIFRIKLPCGRGRSLQVP